ncbi:MAG TPA: ImmA/IrrE family metallo-endopeptidase [Thermodesulfobacteriota bacterium]|nr:ImmA/IrrE family metallo-endopeptidase [Thermodesulfobacteriota bacterium]
MSQSDMIAPILSYDDINKRAEDFLREHKRNKILPVDIESIAEFDLGLNIFPFPNLQETFDIEGFISGDLSVIYVDEFIYYQRPARYRFTLAHEIGHYVFHSDLIASFHPQSVADWSKFILAVDEETYDWLEWQAYSFAAAVLVPRVSLKQNFRKELKSLQPKIDFIRSRGLSAEASQDYIVNAIATKLIGIYDVSADVLNRRISKELQKGYLSLE